MSNPRKPTPSYLLHKRTGRARAVWTDRTGTRHDKLLPGHYDSPESRTAFAQLQLEYEAAPAAISAPSVGITVAEILLAYLDHAERHYRDPDGNPTEGVRHIRTVIRHVREVYGPVPASAFGPLALKAVRQRFVDLNWSRTTVNAQIERVRRIFKWAVAEELVSPLVYQALTAVTGLQRNRTSARETEPIKPVTNAVVDATLPHVNRHIRGLIEFQRLTGCRPGEACRMRRCDLDTSGTVWLYVPVYHKTAWKGKERVIAIGPKAQELLRGYFTPDIMDYLFSPARAVEEFHAGRRANRKTPRSTSQLRGPDPRRIGSKRKRPPAARYNRRAYLTALTRACDRAFPPIGELGRGPRESQAKWWARLTVEQRASVKQWRKARRWHPNQLRHAFATKVRKEHGLEAAQVLLGHAKANITQVYAEKNEALAVAIAAKIG